MIYIKQKKKKNICLVRPFCLHKCFGKPSCFSTNTSESLNTTDLSNYRLKKFYEAYIIKPYNYNPEKNFFIHIEKIFSDKNTTLIKKQRLLESLNSTFKFDKEKRMFIFNAF